MKKFVSFVIALAMILSLVACGSSSDTAETTTAASSETSAAESDTAAEGETTASASDSGTSTAVAPDNDLVVALQADATSMDPHVGTNGFSNQILDEMYECLLDFNSDTEIVPSLASDYSISDDGLSYTFTLQEGITFHDGEPFNAEAVKANFDRGLADHSLSIWRYVENVDSVTVDSEYQVTIKLIEPNNTFINKITQFRMASAAAIELGSDWFATNSAGTGPFVFDDRVDGGYTRLVPNENYWRDGPTVDSLTFQVVPEDASRLAMLQTGEADVIFPFPVTDTSLVESDSSIIVDVKEGITYRYVTLNTEWALDDGRKPFSDVRVRQACNYAFDSDAYAQVVFNGYSTAPTSIFSPVIQYFAEQTPYTADLEKAQELMDEAGYSDGFEVEIICDNTTIEERGATFVQQQLAQIGITVNLVPGESTVNAEKTSAPLESTTVQMWYVNWSASSYDADGSMRSILHGENFPPTGYNTAFWNNEEFNQLLDDALLMTDTDEIADAYAQAQAIAWEECPWIFLGVDGNVLGYKTYVTGLQFNPDGSFVFRTVGLEL